MEVELCEGLNVIGRRAFRDCKSLKRITISSSVRSIGSLAFAGCLKLDEVELNEGLEEIGYDAFRDCNSLRNIATPPACRVGYAVFHNASVLCSFTASILYFQTIIFKLSMQVCITQTLAI